MHSPVLQKEVVSRGERVGATVALGRLEGSQVSKPTLHVVYMEGGGRVHQDHCLPGRKPSPAYLESSRQVSEPTQHARREG